MARGYYGDFQSLQFPKTGKEIVDKCKDLRSRIAAKIREREERIRAVAAESGMQNASDVLLSLESIAEGSSGGGNVNLNVGIAAKIRGEIAERAKERKEVEKLDLIIANLPHNRSFDLTFSELEYFEFYATEVE